MTEPAVVKIRELNAAFRRGGKIHPVLADADLTINKGELACLVGPSGSGKTVILNLLIGALRPGQRGFLFDGDLEVLGEDLAQGFPRDLPRRMGIVFQESALFEDLTTRENVAFALQNQRGLSRKQKKERMEELLSAVGLDDPPSRIHMLSGGQKKRLALARTLAGSPELLLFDEPTTGLDPARCKQIAELIARTHAEGNGERTTLVVTHDYEAVLPIATKVFLLDPGTGSIVTLKPGEHPAERIATFTNDRPDPVNYRQRFRLPQWLEDALHAPTRWVEPFFRFIADPWPGSRRQMAYRFADAFIHPALYVCAAGAVLGGLATFFALQNNPLKGAMDRQAITGLGRVLMAIVIPLVTSVLFAARLGAGAAARLGNIRLGRQDDALRMLGRNPSAHLITPLFWSCLVGLPLLAFPVAVSSALASLGFACITRPITPYGWATSFLLDLELIDIGYALIKLIGSGALVAGAAAYLGFKPKAGAEDLGRDVTASIVAATFLVILWHGILTFIQYD